MAILVLAYVAAAFSASATTHVWTNALGGSWNVAANWKPAGVPTSVDDVYITNNGTYTVFATNAVSIQSGILGGSNGVQTLVMDNGITFTCALWHVQTNGSLVMSNADYVGHIVLHTNGVMRLEGPAAKGFTSMWFLNYGGTMLFRGGSLTMNGSIAWVENDGLWEVDGDNSVVAASGSMIWTNNGTIIKTAGTGESRFSGFNFINNSNAVVKTQSGLLNILGGLTNLIGGTFTADAGATLELSGQTYFDAGGVFPGAGTNQFQGSTLNLRTNISPNLKLMSGQVFLGTNFQQAGVITNLTLDGANLNGTNRVNGTLTINAGAFGNRLTVQPSGTLVIGTSGQKNWVNSMLINQGTVDWTGGVIIMGSGAVSNGGLWKIESDDEYYNGGGPSVLFTNAGTFKKIAGAGGTSMTRLEAMNFVNLNSGLVESDAGILRMPQNYTNTAGTLRLNGGTIGGSPGAFFGYAPIYLAGGTVDGSGTLDQMPAFGGTVSPGNSPGRLQFQSGLNLAAGTTLSIDGTGTTPGTGYDQLSVLGTVAVSNAALQVTSLPAVPFGTSFTIIDNDGSDAVLGTFTGLPENSVFSANGQTYRIHYAGGTGNDVTLVSESGAPPPAPTLSSGGYSNGTFHLLGNGSSSLIYTVQASTNFLQWSNIGTTTGDISGGLNFLDTNASNFRYRFYRVTN